MPTPIKIPNMTLGSDLKVNHLGISAGILRSTGNKIAKCFPNQKAGKSIWLSLKDDEPTVIDMPQITVSNVKSLKTVLNIQDVLIYLRP